jgi:type IV secretion system protein VirD4
MNHSILDNCHVRIAFATNDERTAKRISEALGTATELRAQRNYAGHRLAPWLGHLMVSRQETARPLLTPGEVMQLPPNEAVVMVSGHPPIKAAKLRYYQDRNFQSRVVKPPVLEEGAYADRPAPRPDDWSALIVPPAADSFASSGAGETIDDGGLQQQPELREVALAPETERISDDLALLDDDDIPLSVPTQPDPRLQRAARLAALDPDDGIAL